MAGASFYFDDAVEPGLFATYGVPILAGRPLESADLAQPAAAVVVNRSFVDRVLGGGAALGQRFRHLGQASEGPGGVAASEWYEIVGVVEDFPAKKDVTGRDAPSLYHPLPRGRLNPVSLVVRVQGIAPENFSTSLRAITTEVDPQLRLSRVESVAQLHWKRMRGERVMTLAITFATLSVLLLSAAGIHAMMSFAVTRRRREIGIRTALGAQRRRILRSIFSRALWQLSLGAAVGCLLGGSLIVGQGFSTGRSAILLLLMAAIVLCVGLLATLGPARRGLRIEPTEALRADA